MMSDIYSKNNRNSTKNQQSYFWFYLICLYFIFEYIRPQSIIPFLGMFKIPFLLTVMMLYFFVTKGNKEIFTDSLIKKYLIFVALTLFGLIFAINHYWVVEFGKILTIYLLAVIIPFITIVNDPDRLMRFFNVWIFMHAVLAILTIKSGGIGASSFLHDENDLALTLIVALPYSYFLFQSRKLSLFKRYLYILVFIGVVLAIIETESRGGFLGMAASIMVIIYLSKKRIRNGIIIFILGLSALSFVPESYYQEVESIGDAGDSTRNDRFYLWDRAFHMFADYPFFGVAAGNYPWRLPEYQQKDLAYNPSEMPLRGGMVAHSLYVSIIAEYGIVGSTVFMLIVIEMYKRLNAIRKRCFSANDDNGYMYELFLIGKAMTASLTGFLIAAAFITVTIYPHIWYMIGMLIALDYITNEEEKKLRKTNA